MSPEQNDCPQERHDLPGAALSRRRFLSAGSTAAVTALATVAPASAEVQISPVSEQAMILQLARASAVFPVPVPWHGRARGTRAQRAFSRLRAALRLTKPTLATPATLRAARQWLRLLATMHKKGTLRRALAESGLR